jgi:hypothetical protein
MPDTLDDLPASHRDILSSPLTARVLAQPLS